jgi:hypothetical protein
MIFVAFFRYKLVTTSRWCRRHCGGGGRRRHFSCRSPRRSPRRSR